MKFVPQNQTQEFKHSDTCTAIEYQTDNPNINGAEVKLTGRFPDKNRIVNLKCSEMAYVLKGSGKVFIEGREVKLNPGDLVLIEPNEKYFWDGHLTMFIASHPAWYPEQNKKVK